MNLLNNKLNNIQKDKLNGMQIGYIKKLLENGYQLMATAFNVLVYGNKNADIKTVSTKELMSIKANLELDAFEVEQGKANVEQYANQVDILVKNGYIDKATATNEFGGYINKCKNTKEDCDCRER